MKLHQLLPVFLAATVACSDGNEVFGPDCGESISFGVTEQPATSRAADNYCVPDTIMLYSDTDTCHVLTTVTVSDMPLYNELPSRATPINGTAGVNGFSIYSYFYRTTDAAAQLFFAGENAVRKGSDWTTSTLYYWPTVDGSTLEFWALVGADAPGVTVNNSTTGIEDMTIDYRLPADATQQADLLLATTGRMNTPGQSVPLNFKHLCAAVKFVFGNNMQPGTIQEITLSGIMSTGRYTTRWTGTATPTSFTLRPGLATTGNETPGSAINTDAQTFMMIPQTLGTDAMLTVVFQDNATGNRRTLTAPLTGGEWRQGTVTTYHIGISKEYNLEFTTQPPVQDAHYVICESAINIEGVPDNKTWTLTATAGDNADVTVQLTADINDYVKQGFWTDKEMVNGTPTSTSARGTSTVRGSGSGSFPITVFLPQNVSDNNRTVTLTLSVDGHPATAVTQEITQVCPLWNGNTGWEQIDDNLVGAYGFLYTARHVFIYNFSQASENQINRVGRMVDDLITEYQADNYVERGSFYYRRWEGIILHVGYRYYVSIDYSKLSNLAGKASSATDGLRNTKELFSFGGSAVSSTFEQALRLLRRINNESEAAFRERDREGDEYSTNKTIPDWIDGNAIDESQAVALVLKMNRYYLNKYTDSSTGLQTSAPRILENDITWYLPAQGQFAGMPAGGFPAGDYWSSTAYSDATQSYDSNGALKRRTEQLKIRAAVTRTP